MTAPFTQGSLGRCRARGLFDTLIMADASASAITFCRGGSYLPPIDFSRIVGWICSCRFGKRFRGSFFMAIPTRCQSLRIQYS